MRPDDPTRSFAWNDSVVPRRARLMAFWEGGFLTCDLPTSGALTIGRGETSDLRIDHPSVSRNHARVVVAPLRLEDLGSSNGTLLDGERVPARRAVPLPDGARIQVGGATLMVEVPRAPDPVVETSRRTSKLDQMIDLVAKSSMTVIILGETGVGKDVVAETIRSRSPRASGPMVRVNCAALSEALLDSELFGHERGSFTGATRDKVGLLEAADRGTLFLDEVGEMPPATQVKLLRAIERREIMRVGSVETRSIDVRIIAATHRDLSTLVASGRFRADLYFRLNGISLVIPPLRERVGDIGALAAQFLKESGARHTTLAPEVLERLQRHSWPGNIRELRNIVARAELLSDGQPIKLEHILLDPGFDRELPANGSGSTASPRDSEETERGRIVAALEQAGGNQTRAAKLLGISRRSLVNRLGTYDLPRPRK